MKRIMKYILLCVSSLFLLLVFPDTGRAQVDIKIKVENGNECAKICKNLVGSPGCRHAYLYHKLRPPVCRLTSDRAPSRFAKGTYGIWSKQKGRWLNASDFRKGPGVKDPNRTKGEGYYLIRMSGSGWLKGHRKTSTRSRGYENFLIWVGNSVKKPRKKYYWEFPTGYNMTSMFQRWKKEALDTSRKNCKRPRPLGKLAASPKIWENGPKYEIVSGPHASKPKFGSRRIANGKPGSAFHWVHRSIGNIKRAEAACNKLGEAYNPY